MIGVGVIGFGWLGQAHSRSLLRIPTLLRRARRHAARRAAATRCRSDDEDARALVRLRARHRGLAGGDRRTRTSTSVCVAAPNMLHVELVEAAAAAGKHVFCEKPVGGTPEQTVRGGAGGARGVISGVGYNYRWAPLVQYARAADRRRRARRDHELPRPLLLDVRQRPARRAVLALPRRPGRPRRDDRPDEPHASTSRTCCSARSRASSGTTETFIPERPLPTAAGSPLRAADARRTRRAPSPTRTTPGCCASSPTARAGRSRPAAAIVGPESQMAFEVYGTKGALRLEPRDAQRAAALPRRRTTLHTGYRTVFGGDRFPYHGHSCRARQRDRLRGPRGDRGLRVLPRGGRGARRSSRASRDAAATGSRVQAALLRSAGRPARWEDVEADHQPPRIGVIGVGRIGRMHADLLAREVPGRGGDARSRRRPRGRAGRRRRTAGGAGDASSELLGRRRRRRRRDLHRHRHARRPDRRRRRGRQGDLLREAGVARPRRGRPRARRRSRPPACRSRSASTGASTPPTRRCRGRSPTGEIGEPARSLRITSRDPAPPPLEYVAAVRRDLPRHDHPRLRHGPLRRAGPRSSRSTPAARSGSTRAIGEAGDVDTAVIVLEHENGCLTTIDNCARPSTATTSASRCSARPGWRRPRTRSRTRRPCAPRPAARARRCRTSSSSATSPSYLREWEAFVAAVDAGAPPPVGAADARAPLVIGLAAWQSLREGRAVCAREVGA